ncbi:RDD family protein [Planktothrix sp. FACHB-1365]|uniref:RDD family protein n=1 Tax=Planktothrix sp. FACHB-1365 TaxID=2692855 RepID=UPI0016876A6B|nr:RDD family protein [Planktothrix sp. FACHB-1365]MBD2480905.1 RDD family protein [Planktothrix sp. FACHB-1365]
MTRTTGYAGFEKRFVALLIDTIIFIFIGFIIVGRSPSELQQPNAELAMYLILMQIIGWIYYAILESSSIQGTLGKRVVGIIVTNLQGNQISFGKATARYFAKSACFVFWIAAAFMAVMTPSTSASDSPYYYLSIALFVIGLLVGIVGYLMAGYTPEKQALHDIIARCYIVNGRGQSSSISWKPLAGLAIAVLISKGIFSQVPKNSNLVKEPETTNPQTPTPTPVPTPVPTPAPTPAATPAPEPTENNTGLGELISPPPGVESQTNGVWGLEFAVGATQHQAILSINGDSGFMVVRLPDGKGGIQNIRQTMKLRQSYKGLVIVGEDPTDLDTDKPSDTYRPDNFLIAVRPEKENPVTFRNISVNSDGSVMEFPVNPTFLGYPRIGIKMTELSSQVRDEINQNGSLPFSITQDTGVIIIEVNEDSPAAKADLRPGDIIQSIDGTNVARASDVQSRIISSLLYFPLNFDINREGENLSVKVSPDCCVTQEELNQQQSPPQ